MVKFIIQRIIIRENLVEGLAKFYKKKLHFDSVICNYWAKPPKPLD